MNQSEFVLETPLRPETSEPILKHGWQWVDSHWARSSAIQKTFKT